MANFPPACRRSTILIADEELLKALCGNSRKKRFPPPGSTRPENLIRFRPAPLANASLAQIPARFAPPANGSAAAPAAVRKRQAVLAPTVSMLPCAPEKPAQNAATEPEPASAPLRSPNTLPDRKHPASR